MFAPIFLGQQAITYKGHYIYILQYGLPHYGWKHELFSLHQCTQLGICLKLVYLGDLWIILGQVYIEADRMDLAGRHSLP